VIQDALIGSVAISGRGGLVGTLSADGAGLPGSVAIDGSLSDLVFRTSGPVQRIGFEVWVAGVRVPESDFMAGSFTVDQSMDSHVQTAAFSLALRSPEGRFGNPLDFHGPAFGLAKVDVYGLLRTSSGGRRIPLILNGTAHQVQRKESGGRQEPYQIVDSMGRYDHLTVTLSIPAGAGLTRDAIASRIARQIGIPAITFETCSPVFRIAEYVDADPIRAMQALFDVEGRTAFLTPESVLVNPSWEIAAGELPVWTFRERDIIAGSLDASTPTEVVTDVTLTSTAQVLRSPEEEVGSQPRVTTVTVEALYQPLTVVYVQNSGCSLSALTPPPDSPRIIPISVTTATTESRGGEVVTEETLTEGYKIPEATRYIYAAAGARHCITPVYLLTGADPAGNGTEPAYLAHDETWQKRTYSVTRHYFDDPAFLGPPSTPGSADAPWGNHFMGSPQSTGRRLGKITETSDWYLIGAALKQAVPGTTWEAIDPIVGVETRGDGRGAAAHEESFQVITRQVEVLESTANGYLRSTSVYEFGWSPGVGNAYWYQGTGPAALPQEAFSLLKKTATENVPTGDENSYLQVETTIDYTGNSSPATKTIRNVGAPPAIDVLPSSKPDPAVYDSPEEAKAAMVARNSETRTIVAHVVSEALEEYHPKRIVKTSASDAETADELAAVARRTIALSAAIPVTFQVPFNPTLRLAQVGRIVNRPMGVDATGRITNLRHAVTSRGPSTTTVTILKLPPTAASSASSS